MKATGQRWWLKRNDDHALNALIEWVKLEWLAGRGPTLQMLATDRTPNQNNMFYALYRDIAAQKEDSSQMEVKRICKLHYGVLIRKTADPEWATWYDQAIKPMSYENKLFLMSDYPITSDFNKQQGTEYIQTILSDYGRQGYALADPRGTR